MPRNQRQKRRRAIVAVQVLLTLPVLTGFAALTVDVGTMYNARNDLQRTADAAALAAMGAIAFTNSGKDPFPAAAAAAIAFAEQNEVAGEPLTLNPATDIIFGHAAYDAVSNTYAFAPGEAPRNAVRIVARKTADSENGQVPLFFAGMFGKTVADVSAQAVAMYFDTKTTQADCWDAVPDGMVTICQNGDSDDSDDSAAGDSDDSDDSDSGDSDGATNGDSDDSDDSEAGDSDDSDDSGAPADSDSEEGDNGDSESSDGDSSADSDLSHTVHIDANALPFYLQRGSKIGPCNCKPGDPDDSDDSEAGDSGDSDDSDGDGPGTTPGLTFVTICHVPPGHPTNFHTIAVGQPIVAAHLAHGDTLGGCVGGGKLHVMLIR